MSKPFVIDRSKWITGGSSANNNIATSGTGFTMLLNSTGYMCCLGFYCKYLGVTKKDLKTAASPEDLADRWNIPHLITKSSGSFHWNNTNFSEKAIKLNDNGGFKTLKEREKAIKNHFAKIGVQVKFVEKYKNFFEPESKKRKK